MKRYLVASFLLAAGCGNDSGSTSTLSLPAGFDPKASPTPGAAAAPAAGAAATPGSPAQAPIPGQAAPGTEAEKEVLLAEVRNRKFKNEDFVEADNNRDPFRSFLTDFSGGPTITTPQYEILAP